MQPENKNEPHNQPTNNDEFSTTPDQPTSVYSSSTDLKDEKLKDHLMFISITFGLTAGAWALTYGILTPLSKVGAGTEFIFMIIFIYLLLPLSIITFAIAIFALITLPFKLKKSTITPRLRMHAAINLCMSVVVLLVLGWYAYLTINGFYQTNKEMAIEAENQRQANLRYKLLMKPTAIELPRLQELLDSCKVFTIGNTDQSELDDDGVEDVESSTTGIVSVNITRDDTKERYRIHVADRMVEQTLPLVRAVQQKCKGLQFWHNGRYI